MGGLEAWPRESGDRWRDGGMLGGRKASNGHGGGAFAGSGSVSREVAQSQARPHRLCRELHQPHHHRNINPDLTAASTWHAWFAWNAGEPLVQAMACPISVPDTTGRWLNARGRSENVGGGEDGEDGEDGREDMEGLAAGGG